MQVKNHIRRIIIAFVGASVVVVGVLLLVLPGPGWVVIIFGLAILASEFAWAEARLNKLKHFAKQNKQRVVRKNRSASVDKRHDMD